MVDYTDVGRDTGTKTVKVLSSFNLEAFLHALQSRSAGVGGRGSRGVGWRVDVSQEWSIPV